MKRDHQSTEASKLKSALPVYLQQILSYATETGASSWLTALPVEEHGFALHKGAFRDAICLRYGWHPSGLPSLCTCSKNFTVELAMNGGVEDGARLDVAASGFWGSRHQKVFLDVKVFNPNALSYRGSSLSSLYRRLEKEKQRKYEQRIREVEIGCFTPLVFSTSEGMSTICDIFFKRLASLLADKKYIAYSVVMSWLHCYLNFSLLCSAIDCLRGARSSRGCPASLRTLDLALSEGQVSLHH